MKSRIAPLLVVMCSCPCAYAVIVVPGITVPEFSGPMSGSDCPDTQTY
ncbi:hypothetical protein [uncultured Muribaculum sp.]|nr:hypothetical protein [uncultured Muribaculum sp.]